MQIAKLTGRLLPIAEAIAGSTVSRFTVEDGAALEEGSPDGDVSLVSFRIDGREPVTVVAKRCVWNGVPESVHYQHFALHGVPTPTFYGAVAGDSGAEIIFIELLESIGLKDSSAASQLPLLMLLARLNACPITTDYEPSLGKYTLIGMVGPGMWLSGLNPWPSDERLRRLIAVCGVDSADQERMTSKARELFNRVAGHATGLLHLDFVHRNTGRRGGSEELLVFDLHKNARGPRFADVSPYLIDTPDQEVLAAHYLRAYVAFSGTELTMGQLLDECADLYWAHKIGALDWLASERPEYARRALDYLRG